MLTHKYIDGGTGLNYATFTQTGSASFSVTAPQTLGVWKVYVYAYDGHGNVGIETKSFTVVPPPVNGTNVGRGKPATASSSQAPLNGATFGPGNAVDGNLSTRWATDWSRSTVDPAWTSASRPRSTTSSCVWESAYAKAYQIQTSHRRYQLDDRLLDDHRRRRGRRHRPHRYRPVRADVRHRARHDLRLLALRVRDLQLAVHWTVRRRGVPPPALALDGRCGAVAAGDPPRVRGPGRQATRGPPASVRG